MMKIKVFLVLFLSLALLAGCGQKGPLVPPPAAAAHAFRALLTG